MAWLKLIKYNTHIIGRGVAYPSCPFFRFCPSPHLPFPVTSNPHPSLLFLLSCFFGWMGDCATFDGLFYFTDVCHIMWFFAGTLIWYHTHSNTHTHTYTHTQTHMQHTQGPVGWHTHINIYLHQLLCAHSSYLYYTESIIHWYQKFTFRNVFSFQKLFTCKSPIGWWDAIILGSSYETQIILIEMV